MLYGMWDSVHVFYIIISQVIFTTANNAICHSGLAVILVITVYKHLYSSIYCFFNTQLQEIYLLHHCLFQKLSFI